MNSYIFRNIGVLLLSFQSKSFDEALTNRNQHFEQHNIGTTMYLYDSPIRVDQLTIESETCIITKSIERVQYYAQQSLKPSSFPQAS